MGEYISKQSVIDYLEGYLNSIGECGADSLLFDRGQRRALINSIQDISAVKAADVHPVKHGRWIRHGKPEDYFWNCSECKNWIIYAEHDLHKHHFCGNCGSRMDGDSE